MGKLSLYFRLLKRSDLLEWRGRMKTTAYKNKYNASHYDRINLFVPKGEKDRKIILTITGSTKEGYTIRLKKGYIYSETGMDSFFCRTKPDIRKNVKKCLAQDI